MLKIKCFKWFALCLLTWNMSTQALSAQDVVYNDIPNWVTVRDLPQLEFSKLSADYLIFDKQVRVFEDQEVTFKRVAYRLNTNSGVEQLSDIFLGFDPAYETLQIHEVNVLRNGEIINRLNPEDITVSEESSEYLMHTGRMQAKLLLKDIRKGDIIDYSYSIDGKNPVFGNKFTDSISLQWGAPLASLNLSIMIEKDRELFHKIHLADDAKIQQSADEKWRYYSYSATDLDAIEEQSELPYWYSPYPYVEFSEYKNWAEVADWAVELFDVQLQENAPLQAYIAELKTMEKEKAIDEAINFVQEQVRYLGLELGENSHRPHHPDEVFDNRYGDCKDKTLLLKTLLAQIGVESFPALVSSYQTQEIFKSLASPSVFDHVILYIDYDDGYWVDPTKTHQSTRLTTLHQPNYGAALLVNSETVELVSAKPTPQGKKIVVQENYYAGDYSSPVELEVTTTYYGGSAERFRYRVEQNSLDEITADFLDYYRRIFPDIRLSKELTVIDDKEQNILILQEQYMVPDYWYIEEGETSSSYELYNQSIGEYLVKPDQIKRYQPYAQYHPITIEYQSNLHISEWIDLSWPDDLFVVDNEYFNLKTLYINDISKLSMTSLYTTKKDYVEADDIRDYMDDIDQGEDNIYVNQSITNVTNAQDYESVENMLFRLNNNRNFKD